MAAVDTSTVYRDATYSARTQELLRQLLGRLTSADGWNTAERGEEIQALTDVVQRWDANEATEIVVNDEPPAIASPLLSPDPMFVDSSISVYKAACPECGRALEWAIETPPIPRTLYSWFNDGQRILECPECPGVDLPEGDLTKLARVLAPVIVMRASLCYASACADGTVSRTEIEAVVNSSAPTGIRSRWEIADETFADGQPNPCPCPDHEGRLHYLFVC